MSKLHIDVMLGKQHWGTFHWDAVPRVGDEIIVHRLVEGDRKPFIVRVRRAIWAENDAVGASGAWVQLFCDEVDV